VPVTGQFSGGYSAADLLQGVAVLEVLRPEDSSFYWAAVVADAGRVIGWQLRKFGTGELYFVNADCTECDCPDAVYRGRACKHMAALRQALSPLTTAPAPEPGQVAWTTCGGCGARIPLLLHDCPTCGYEQLPF
jgi:hypothetical protein